MGASNKDTAATGNNAQTTDTQRRRCLSGQQLANQIDFKKAILNIFRQKYRFKLSPPNENGTEVFL